MKRDRARDLPLLAALVIIILLGGSFAYYYASSSSEISLLTDSGQTLCKALVQFNNPLEDMIANGTAVMQQEIQNNTALIASLNSTKPLGYASMIGTLTHEVSQEKSLLALISELNIVSSVPADYRPACGVFGVP
jgi:hypothetical protein